MTPRILLAGACLFLITTGPTARAQRPPAAEQRFVELPASSEFVSVNPDGGALAIATGNAAPPAAPITPGAAPATAESVTLYPDLSAKASAANPVTRKIPGGPVAGVAFKKLPDGKPALIVLCQGDRSIHLLDPATLEPLGTPVALKAAGRPYGLAVSQRPDAPYAFYIAGTQHDARAWRVNLATGADEGKISAEDSVFEVAASADGSTLYGRRPTWSPSGVNAWRIAPGARADASGTLATTVLARRHEDSRTYHPDPFGQYCAFGPAVYAADLSKPVPTPSVTPVLFLPDRPVIFALPAKSEPTGPITVHALSYNTFKPVGSVEVQFPAPANDADRPAAAGNNPRGVPPTPGAVRRPGAVRAPRPTNRTAQPPPGAPSLHADTKNNNLLCVRGTSVAVVPIRAFALPDEPLLYAAVDTPPAADLGKPLSLKVTRPDSRAKVELRDAPEGMKLDGDRLTWTPARPGDVGTVRVGLRVFAGDLERVQEVSLTVRRPAVDLPFVPDDLRVSANGKIAAVLWRGQDPHRPQTGASAAAPGAQVAVVDLATRAVTARRTLPVDATTLAVDSRFVYVGLRDSDAFYVLSRTDLADHKRVFTTGRPQQLVPVADQYVFAAVSQDRQQVSRFKLPDFAADEAPAGTRPVEVYRPYPAAPPVPVAGGYYYDGAVYDAEFRRARLLVAPIAFPALSSRAVVFNSMTPVQYDTLGRAAAPVARWGVTIVPGGTIKRLSGQSIGQSNEVDQVLLDDAPAVAVLRRPESRNSGDGNTPARDRWELVLRDLLTGAASTPVVLQDEPISREGMYRHESMRGDGRSTRLTSAAGGTLVALVRDRLYVLTPDALPIRDLPTPLHFELAQETLTIDSDKPTTLSPVARGGKQPIQFSAAVEFPGIDVDRATGKVTLDPARLRQPAADLVWTTLQNAGFRHAYDPVTRRPADPEQVVAGYVAPTAKAFAELVGRPPKGVPVFVPIPLTARDAEQQAANYDGGVFLEVPTEVFVDRMRKQAEQARAQNEAIRAAQAAATRPAADPAELATLRRRIAELEQRNQQLEAQVQLLKEMVQGQGRPAPDTNKNRNP